MGMKTQFRQSIKLSTPTFPVPGGPYNRTPDRLSNLEQYTSYRHKVALVELISLDLGIKKSVIDDKIYFFR